MLERTFTTCRSTKSSPGTTSAWGTRRHLETQAALHDPIEEQALFVHHGVTGKVASRPQRQQRRDAGGGVFGLNCAIIASAC